MFNLMGYLGAMFVLGIDEPALGLTRSKQANSKSKNKGSGKRRSSPSAGQKNRN